MSEVVNIGEFAFKHKRWPTIDSAICKHVNLTMCDEGHTVKCNDCGDQLSAYFILGRMIESYKESRDLLIAQRNLFEAEKSKEVVLLAAKKIEKAWRSRSTVPACPHCHKAILPTDRLGSITLNKVLELKRRAIKGSGQ